MENGKDSQFNVKSSGLSTGDRPHGSRPSCHGLFFVACSNLQFGPIMTTPPPGRRFELHLRAGKWHTVALHLGLTPRKVDVSVWSPRRCSWRRIGFVPGAGVFRQDERFLVYNGFIQIRSPENRTCVVQVHP